MSACLAGVHPSTCSSDWNDSFKVISLGESFRKATPSGNMFMALSSLPPEGAQGGGHSLPFPSLCPSQRFPSPFFPFLAEATQHLKIPWKEKAASAWTSLQSYPISLSSPCSNPNMILLDVALENLFSWPCTKFHSSWRRKSLLSLLKIWPMQAWQCWSLLCVQTGPAVNTRTDVMEAHPCMLPGVLMKRKSCALRRSSMYHLGMQAALGCEASKGTLRL